MNNVHGNSMLSEAYGKNDTMHLLGYQNALSIFWSNDSVRKSVKEISEARPYNFTLEAAADLFMLGYIYGKRAERAKRKVRGSVINKN